MALQVFPTAAAGRDAFSDLLTETSKRRQISPIRQIFPLLGIPGMVSFGGGMPNPSTFPITRLAMDVRIGPEGGADADAEGDANASKTLTLQGASLTRALQYSTSAGFPALLVWLAGLQQREHGITCRPPADTVGATHDVTVTAGSQDGLAKVLEMVVAPGDFVLLAEASYSGALAFLTPLGAKFATVRTDAYGIVPEALEKVLASFPPAAPNEADAEEEGGADGLGGAGGARAPRPTASRPRVLYTIPTGSNPSGASMTAERKRAIYEIARRPENNLLILEDDPYYYIRFDDASDGGGGTAATAAAATAAAATAAAATAASSAGGGTTAAAATERQLQEGTTAAKSHPRAGVSFLSLDVDSRVVRFDSLSKVVAAGLRLGFVTAPPAVADRLRMHMQSTLLHACVLAQALAVTLLAEWGYDGFLAHTLNVAAFYKHQRDAFLRAAERHLGPGPEGLGHGRVTWTTPSAGMFVWLDLAGLGIRDTHQLVMEDCAEAKVLFVPGAAFVPGSNTSTHLRASFSMAAAEDMDDALKRFAAVLRRKFIAPLGGP